jgi:hypothetical protein
VGHGEIGPPVDWAGWESFYMGGNSLSSELLMNERGAKK